LNVVLIALDTQRADHLGCYGYERDTSPFIDGVAGGGVLFERCYAPNIPTHPSFTTMFSGKEAITHDIINISGRVPIAEGVKLLPEILKENGWATAAVDSMGAHFARGFDVYATYDWDRSVPTELRQAETVTNTALPVVERLLEQEDPFFLFVHYWDPHTPYLPPDGYRRRYYPVEGDPYDEDNRSMDPAWEWEPFKWYFHEWMPGITDSEYVNNLYDGETRYMDDHLRPLFDALAPVSDDTLIILTADHGEVLDDHDGFYDHHGLYDANVRVPFVLSWPGRLPEGRRVPGFVQNTDLAPTILDLAGIPDRHGMEGVSLLPALFGLRDGNYDEVYYSEATWQLKRAVRTGRWKLIQALAPDPHGGPMRELYDLESDPQEQRNVVEEHPEVAEELGEKLRLWVERRLKETGRTEDPISAQGVAGTSIGTPVPDEIPGPGATPLHLRDRTTASTIPGAADLNAPNEARDTETDTPLHGYVEEQRDAIRRRESDGPVRLGVISFAHAHINPYMESIEGFADAEIVAGWDDDKERGAAACDQHGVEFVGDLDDLLGRDDVDAVFITSQTNRHAEHAVAAAEAGKHVLLQKPMALTLQDCDEIIAAVEQTGVKFSMCYQMRADPVNLKMKELLDEGAVGKVAVVRRRHAIPMLLNPDFARPGNWHIDPEQNLGMFMDDASHAADWFLWILGRPTSVIAEIDNVVTDAAPDDNGVAVYRFSKGEMGILLNSSTILAAEATTEIYGDEGSIVQDYGDLASSSLPRPPGATALKIYRSGSDDWERFDLPADTPHGDRIAAVPRPLVDYLKGERGPLATAQEGKVCVEMILGAYRSAREGRRVSLPV
jgi:predicted dehydrogenase/arylsulfatase A-like enzyme